MTDAVDTMGDDWLAEAGGHVEEVVEIVEAAPAEVIEPADEAPEDIDGAEPPAKSPHMVPYSEMRKEREAKKELERRIAALEANKPAPAKEVIPDAYEDPEGFNEWNLNREAQNQFAVRAELSGMRAELKYGQETVDAALEWAKTQTDPTLQMKVRAEASPVEFIVKEHKRSLTHQTLGEKSLEDYARDYAVSQGWIVSQPQTETPASQKPSLPKAPRSLATIHGSGNKAPANADWGEVKFALDN